MFSIPFILNPPPSAVHPFFLVDILIRKHHIIEIGKELFHCAYFGLMFLYHVGSVRWYLYTALPLLAITLLSIVASKGGN